MTRLPGALARLLQRSDEAVAARAFDPAFYLAANPDVAAAGLDPFEHFMAFGWREGRDPSPAFSLSAYVSAFPDVAAADVNPYVHYLTHGRPKVAAAESPLGFRYEAIEGLSAIGDRLPRGPDALSRGDLSAALARARDGLRRLHITFGSHSAVESSGARLAIEREGERLAQVGRDHLHLHPPQAWPVTRRAAEAGGLRVVLNGQDLGCFAPQTVGDALAAAPGEGSGRSFAIHGLLGHAVDATGDILDCAGLRKGVFWLHDFASVCASHRLLRDDVEDCPAPPGDSAACSVCVYGPWRAGQAADHGRLFERLELTVAAPSQAVLDTWTRVSGLRAATAVLPCATLTPNTPGRAPKPGRAFRLAYVGPEATHAGWPVFRAIAGRFAHDPRYEFLHLCPSRGRGGRARVRSGDLGPGLGRALEAKQPDAVLCWPLFRDPFPLVAYAAAAAGCAVIAGPDNPEVAAVVEQTRHGVVLADEAALANALQSGAILELARVKRRPMHYQLSFSAFSLDLPAAPTA